MRSACGTRQRDGSGILAPMASFCEQCRNLPRALHALDGRVKIALMLAYSVSLFLLHGTVGLVAAAGLLALAVVAGRVRVGRLLRQGAPALVLAAFLLLYQVANAGWATGAMVAGRVVLLVYAGLVLAALSTEKQLAEALQRLLAPLAQWGVPVRDVTAALSIALRFLPLTARELACVRAAQRSRGASLEAGGLYARLRANAALMVPLFVGLFRRADRLAAAMDARCFGATAMPTSLNARRLSLGDGVVLVVGCGLCLGLVLLP
ncbi:energy-coupling factor transporter transmembrane component T [Adlercreutzia sp. R7]|uniref:Energy-coupling factor transporter transmembrane component T n=1 Tax=Adlercreutzia wanghongyangiae TaxID=3111451 RepID=A0ABU6II48_9ACTN|nr:energy-coupling factor transporter transmembrane component T [Adlercreutzia sp. R7]